MTKLPLLITVITLVSCTNNKEINQNSSEVKIDTITNQVDDFAPKIDSKIAPMNSQEDAIRKNYNDNLFEFKKYIDQNKIGIKITEITQDSSVYQTTYLGSIKIENSRIYVISQFYTIQAAIARHGHSRILFLNSDGKLQKEYILDMPEELPTGIKNNRLRIGGLLFEEFKEELPSVICIPKGGCY